MPFTNGIYSLPFRIGSKTPAASQFSAQVGADFDELAGIVNNQVKSLSDFGATGSLSSDATTSFTDAFAWLNSSQKNTLMIPPGDYVKTGTHTVSQSFSAILGQGYGQAIIYQEDDLDSIVFESANPGSDFMGGCTFNNVSIRRTIGTAASSGVDLKFVRQFGDRISGVNLLNSVNGLQIIGGDTYFIDSLNIQGNTEITSEVPGSALFKVASFSASSQPNVVLVNNLNISGGAFNPNIDYAILVTGCDTLYLSNGHVGQTKTALLKLESSSLPGDFISSVGASNVFFDGGNCQYGLLIDSPNTVINNTVIMTRLVGCTISGCTVDGVKTKYPSYDTIVNDNLFIANSGGFGINCSGGAGTIGFTAIGNRFSNFVAHGTNIGGDAVGNASTLITNNNTG